MATFNRTISRRVYKKRLREGVKYVKIVADLLRIGGFTVETPEQKIRQIRVKYTSDQGDIHIMAEGKIRFTLEVKSRDLEFTGIEDYPYKSVFIDNVNQWNYKKHKVAAVIIISQITGKMFVIPLSSRKHWREEEITDREKHDRVQKYMVHKMHCITFEQLVEKLKVKMGITNNGK